MADSRVSGLGNPGLKAATVAWLLVYVPVYSNAYGAGHFLQLCNLGVLLTCAGILAESALLISIPALWSPILALFWITDLVALTAFGQPLHGGTRYLFDPQVSSIARALSLYHPLLPIGHLLLLARVGYDGRALAYALGATFCLGLVSMLLPWLPDNLNYVDHWPNGQQVMTSPLAHGLFSWLLLVLVVLLPAHLLWQWRFNFSRKQES